MLSQNQRKNYVDLKNTIVLEFAEAKTCTEIYIYPYIKIELPHILQNGFEMRLIVCLWKCSTKFYIIVNVWIVNFVVLNPEFT